MECGDEEVAGDEEGEEQDSDAEEHSNDGQQQPHMSLPLDCRAWLAGCTDVDVALVRTARRHGMQ